MYAIRVLAIYLNIKLIVLPCQDPAAGSSSTTRTTNDTQYSNAVDAIRRILRGDGVLGSYSGLESFIVSTALVNVAYFYWSSAARTHSK